MNLDYWLRRLSGRATCVLGEGSRLQSTARIRNIRGDDASIRVGSNSLIAGELLTFAHGGQITVGDWCFIGEGSRVWSSLIVDIGDRVLISHNVNIFDSLTHPVDAGKRHKQFKAIMTTGHPIELDLDEQAVTIGDDVWIGANACILRGVNLGDGAVIGAGAVVTGEVPARSIFAGNPARLVRELAEDEH